MEGTPLMPWKSSVESLMLATPFPHQTGFRVKGHDTKHEMDLACVPIR